jgi:hypothetical protein
MYKSLCVFCLYQKEAIFHSFDVPAPCASPWGSSWLSGTKFLFDITGMHLVLFGMHNRICCPYLTAIIRVLISVVEVPGHHWNG